MNLRDQLFGERTPSTVTETFRAVRAPGRSLRDCDDAAAAEAWRLEQADRLIKSVYGENGPPPPDADRRAQVAPDPRF